MKSFSEKVRDARELLGLNQQELADTMGVSRRTIVAYESGEKLPRQSSLRKLASALQVSMDYLNRDDIDDPTYGLEKEPYVDEVRERLGAKAAREIDFLMEKNNALFAGGEIPQETKDAYFEAVMAAYLECKEQAKKKFGRKKN